MTHALEPLTSVSLLGRMLNNLALSLPLIVDEAASIDVSIGIDLITLSLAHVIFPLALIYAYDLVAWDLLLLLLLLFFLLIQLCFDVYSDSIALL